MTTTPHRHDEASGQPSTLDALGLPGPVCDGVREIAAWEGVSVSVLLDHVEAQYRRGDEDLGRAMLVFAFTYLRRAASGAVPAPISGGLDPRPRIYDPRREV